MSYKLAIHVLATFTEQVVPIHNYFALNSLDIWNTNSQNETYEKARDEVI